jgi:hypothetical protein
MAYILNFPVYFGRMAYILNFPVLQKSNYMVMELESIKFLIK